MGLGDIVYVATLAVLALEGAAPAEVVKIWSVNGEFLPNKRTAPCSDITEAQLVRIVAKMPLVTVRDPAHDGGEIVVTIDATSSGGERVRKDADRVVVAPEPGGRRVLGFWDDAFGTVVISISQTTSSQRVRPVRMNVIRRYPEKPSCTTQWVGSGTVQ